MFVAGISLPATTVGPLLAMAQEEASPAPTPEEVQIPTPPIIAVQAVPNYGTAPLTVGFSATVVDPDNVAFAYYKWDFGDGHVSVVPPPFTANTYAKPGSYVVTVTAVTLDGRSAIGTTAVIVRSAGQG